MVKQGSWQEREVERKEREDKEKWNNTIKTSGQGKGLGKEEGIERRGTNSGNFGTKRM